MLRVFGFPFWGVATGTLRLAHAQTRSLHQCERKHEQDKAAGGVGDSRISRDRGGDGGERVGEVRAFGSGFRFEGLCVFGGAFNFFGYRYFGSQLRAIKGLESLDAIYRVQTMPWARLSCGVRCAREHVHEFWGLRSGFGMM